MLCTVLMQAWSLLYIIASLAAFVFQHWIYYLSCTTYCEHNNHCTGHTSMDQLQLLQSNCYFPGNTLTFAECTVEGQSGVTIWTGSAFNCTGNSNEITLGHSSNSFRLEAGSCNNRSIIGRGVEVVDDHYTSQLNITFSCAMIGKTVKCFYDNFNTTVTVGTLNITYQGTSSCLIMTACDSMSYYVYARCLSTTLCIYQ